MAWEKDNRDGADFFRGVPSDLKPVTIVAQALDNQWVPNGLLTNLLNSGKPLKEVVKEREKLVRREFLRGLLNSENVVANRAYLFNNDSVVEFYQSHGHQAEAFKELVSSRVLIPFLFSEESPHQSIDLSRAFDRDKRAFESWQELCRECKPSCIRLSWPKPDGSDRDNTDLIRSHLARPFHDYGTVAVNGEPALYAQHLGIAKSHYKAFTERLIEVAQWFSSAPVGDDGKRQFRQRNDFYKQFVVVDGKNVQEGWYDGKKPFAAELKRLIDLKYNTNLADAIGRFALTPIDSLPRLALQEDRIPLHSARGQVDAESLTLLLRRILTDLVQRKLDVPFLDSVDLRDIIAIRETENWRNYVQRFGGLLDSTSSWSKSGIPMVEINDHLQSVFEHYSQVTSSLADMVRKRHIQSVRTGFEVTYGISLSVMGQVIALISPKGGILFTALAELVKPHLPVEKPAQVVCKLFFKDPSRSDVLELEADMMETRLPHAREEFEKLVNELKRMGFSEDLRMSLGEEEAKINVGRPEDQ